MLFPPPQKRKESSWQDRFQNIKMKFFVLKKMLTLELISSL